MFLHLCIDTVPKHRVGLGDLFAVADCHQRKLTVLGGRFQRRPIGEGHALIDEIDATDRESEPNLRTEDTTCVTDGAGRAKRRWSRRTTCLTTHLLAGTRDRKVL